MVRPVIVSEEIFDVGLVCLIQLIKGYTGQAFLLHAATFSIDFYNSRSDFPTPP
jgi:hypothetical protein